ncbi:MAG: DUF4388 domain-containing protein [Acidobacteria bacterium]|nr:DUF4388 domain-containing protein [Acidobacteriota bacterium]MCB9377544.1 DUF4388 domain-containing protein [Holophagales bacterium]
MERPYHYRGDLRQTALPEMLAIIHRTEVSGVIEASYGEFTKRVWLGNGCVVHATSSDIADSLGSFLRRTDRLSDGQFQAAMQRRGEESGRRLGEILIEQAVLTPAQVYQAIREQIESIVWSLFSWEEGTVGFVIGDRPVEEIVRIQIPLRQVIVRGVKRASNAKTLVARMGGRDTLFEPSFKYEDTIEIALDEEEYRLLAQVDGQRSLYDLCTHGPLSAAENARLLYAYSVLGLIRKATTTELPTPSGGIRIKLKPEG